MSWRLLRTSLRAVSTARSFWAGSDLQCTDWNQPRRINWAIPRASLRSDFTDSIVCYIPFSTLSKDF